MNDYNQIKVTVKQEDADNATAVMTAMDFFGGLMIEDFSDIDTCPWDYVDEELLKKVPEGKRTPLTGVLSQDPRPSYQEDAERVYGLRFSDMEVKFRVKENTLTVVSVEKV